MATDPNKPLGEKIRKGANDFMGTAGGMTRDALRQGEGFASNYMKYFKHPDGSANWANVGGAAIGGGITFFLIQGMFESMGWGGLGTLIGGITAAGAAAVFAPEIGGMISKYLPDQKQQQHAQAAPQQQPQQGRPAPNLHAEVQPPAPTPPAAPNPAVQKPGASAARS